MRKVVTLIALLVVYASASAITRYSHPQNGFAALMANGDNIAVIKNDNSLEINNNSTHDYCLLDTTTLPSTFRYSVRFANANNHRGKSVKVTNDNGSECKVSNQRWGVVVDAMPNGDMVTIELEVNNSDIYNDVSEGRAMKVTVNKYTSTGSSLISSVSISKDVNLFDGDNALSVDVDGNNLRVLIGRKKPKTVIETTIERDVTISRVGILAGPGSCVNVKRTMINYEQNNRIIKHTKWNTEALIEHFNKSLDPVEGFWTYLDRETEDNIAKTGGKYTIATVKNDNGNYDIIYIDGAMVNDTKWKQSMLKGELRKTIFTGNYDAMWIDSNFEPITEDVQATIENGVILTIKFPILKSQLRFSKVIDSSLIRPTSGHE